MRLVIAAWEEGASRRAQGWAGVNGDRSTSACTSRKSQQDSTIHPVGGEERARFEGALILLYFTNISDLKVKQSRELLIPCTSEQQSQPARC